MRHLRSLASAASLFLLLAACSSAGGDTPTDEPDTGAAGSGGSGASGGDTLGKGPGPALTLKELCEKTSAPRAAWCAYDAKCCTDADRNDTRYPHPCIGGKPPSVDECVADYQEAMAAGGFGFDGTWASSCIAAMLKTVKLPPSTCSGFSFGDPAIGHDDPDSEQILACRNTFPGKIAKGGTCKYAFDCAGDTRCYSDAPTATKAVYTCRDPGSAGSSCIDDAPCASGLSCVHSGTDGMCRSKSSPGGNCLYTSECTDGLVCGGSACVMPGTLGASCSFTAPCAYDLVCMYPAGSGKAQCTTPKPEGTTCGSSPECTGRCDATTKKCVKICGGNAF